MEQNNTSVKVDNKVKYNLKINYINHKLFYYSKNIARIILLLNEQQFLINPHAKLSVDNLQIIQLLRSHCDRYDSMVNKNIHLKNGDRKTHYDLFYSNMSSSLNCFDWDDPNLGKFLDKLSHFQ